MGETDQATGLTLTFVDHGEWTATTAPKRRFTLTWTTPEGVATVVRVLAVRTCPAPAKSTGVPCVTTKTKLPSSIASLVVKAPASSRTASWTWDAWEDIGGAVAYDKGEIYAIVATFTTGSTVKTVVIVSAETCFGCTY